MLEHDHDSDNAPAFAPSGFPAALFAEMAEDFNDGIRCEAAISEEELVQLAEQAAKSDVVIGRIDVATREDFLAKFKARFGYQTAECLLCGMILIPAPGYVAPDEIAAMEDFVKEHNARVKELAFEGVRVRPIGRRFTASAKVAGGEWQAVKGRFHSSIVAERAARELLEALRARRDGRRVA